MEQFHDGRIFSVDDLCEELGRTERTVRRILRELCEQGAPIESETRSGGKKYFYIREENRELPLVHRLRFNTEEIQALWVAVQAARSVLAPTPLLAPLDTAFDTLKSALPKRSVGFHIVEQAQQWHFGTAAMTELQHEVFTLLQKARAERQSVRFDYITASTGRLSQNRKVDPYGFALRGTTWLLIGFCHTRKAIRDFAIADISNIRLCNAAEEECIDYDIPKDFDLDLHFRDRFNALASGEPYTVRLLVEQNRAQYFRRKLYHPTQQIEVEHPDGRIEVSYEVLGLDEIRAFIQGWGSYLKVLEPEELVGMIREDIAKLDMIYKKVL